MCFVSVVSQRIAKVTTPQFRQAGKWESRGQGDCEDDPQEMAGVIRAA